MAEEVWDRFLTERDRAHSRLQPPVRRGFGDRPALLLVDLYRRVFGDEPRPLLETIETWPSSCGLAGWEALPYIQRLMRAARAAEIPVIHVTGLPELPGWRHSARGGGQAGGTAPSEVERRARDYEIMPEVAPVPGEVVLRKSAPSAFWGTPLTGYLNQLAIDSLLVAGESTSGCVRASVVDACTYRYRVTVVEECVFDRTEAAHAINLFDMAHKYADVRGIVEVAQYLENLAASDGGRVSPH
ncbi:MAG: isochorismatase family protein [Nocardioidaceae bacterium]